jgi:hypothetical protein
MGVILRPVRRKRPRSTKRRVEEGIHPEVGLPLKAMTTNSKDNSGVHFEPGAEYVSPECLLKKLFIY